MSRVTVMDSVTYPCSEEARGLPAAEPCSPSTLSRAADRRWRRLGWRTLAGICLALPAASSPSAAEIALVWDRVDDPRIATYQVHYGPASRDYDNHKVATESKVVVAGLQPGRRYYFAVRACAADGVTCSGFSNEVSAVVSGSVPPIADFSVSARSGTAPFSTTFSDRSLGVVSARAWSFGDGGSSSAATVVHTYSDAGTYRVSLTVTGPGGSATATKPALIEVAEPAPLAGAPPAVTPPAPVLDAGEVQIDHQWHWVAFSDTFTDPIVVAKPLSANGPDPAVVRVAGITSDGFWIRVQEWDYLDGFHGPEAVSYLAMERGRHEVAEGVWAVAGRVESGSAGREVAVSFPEPFAETPLVFAGVSSVNEADAVTARLDGIDTLGFRVWLQEQAANGEHPPVERVDYIAWPPSAGELNGRRFEVAHIADPITHEPYTVSLGSDLEGKVAFLADIQTTRGTDPVAMRWRRNGVSELDLWLEEEQSADPEVSHVPEDAGYLLIWTE